MTDLTIIIVQKYDHIHLRRSLESVAEFSQINKFTKVIIKSFGKTDDHACTICNDFSELLDLSHIVCLDNSIYDAMNQAAAHVRTKYLMFLNAGDVFSLPIPKIGSELAKDPYILKYLVQVEDGKVRLERASWIYFLRRMLNHQGLIYSRESFGDGFHPDNLVAGDLRHIVEHGRYKKISYVDEVLVEYLGNGFAAQEKNVLKNWCERRRAYSWVKSGLFLRFALSTFAFLRLKMRRIL